MKTPSSSFGELIAKEHSWEVILFVYSGSLPPIRDFRVEKKLPKSIYSGLPESAVRDIEERLRELEAQGYEFASYNFETEEPASELSDTMAGFLLDQILSYHEGEGISFDAIEKVIAIAAFNKDSFADER